MVGYMGVWEGDVWVYSFTWRWNILFLEEEFLKDLIVLVSGVVRRNQYC